MTDLGANLIAAGRKLSNQRLTWGASGNISCRAPDEGFLISASGIPLGSLTDQDLVACKLSGPDVAPVGRPSVEVRMHRAVYARRPDVDAVVHASPFYVTLVASSSLRADPTLTTDTAYFIRHIERVAFHAPGSAELAEAVGVAARHADILLLDNHGALVAGSSPLQTILRLEALEMLCHMTVVGALGIPLLPIDPSKIAPLLQSLEGYETV